MDPVAVTTPAGAGRLVFDLPQRPPGALLLLGHGAGGGIDAFDLAALAELLPARGIGVVRHEQPWRVAGRKVAPAPATLDAGWRPALAEVDARFPEVPLFVGGRSAGARVACRCFAAPALGVVCLSFPLHPPGKPGASRVDELAAVPVPVLVVQGDRDPFGGPDEVRAALAGSAAAGRVRIIGIPGTHSFAPRTRAAKETGDSIRHAIADAVAGFLGTIG